MVRLRSLLRAGMALPKDASGEGLRSSWVHCSCVPRGHIGTARSVAEDVQPMRMRKGSCRGVRREAQLGIMRCLVEGVEKLRSAVKDNQTQFIHQVVMHASRSPM